MGRLMISSSQMCISREQEEFLAAYRTDKARQAFIDSYGKEKVNFLDGGYFEEISKPIVPEPVLPYDFEVEYLETSGLPPYCYIDTLQVVDTFDFLIKTKFAFTTFVNYGYIFSNEYGGGYYTRLGLNANPVSDLVVTLVNVGFTSLNVDRSYLLNPHEYTLDGVNKLFYYDDESLSLRSQSTINNNASIILFLGAPAAPIQGVGRMYYFRFEKENMLMLDLIPVSKDGVGYMYDRVSGNLFAAQGGGSFIVGPRI